MQPAVNGIYGRFCLQGLHGVVSVLCAPCGIDCTAHISVFGCDDAAYSAEQGMVCATGLNSQSPWMWPHYKTVTQAPRSCQSSHSLRVASVWVFYGVCSCSREQVALAYCGSPDHMLCQMALLDGPAVALQHSRVC